MEPRKPGAMSTTDAEGTITTYPVFDKTGAPAGSAQDSNHINVETDEECTVVLAKIRASLKLSKEEEALLDLCSATVAAKVGECIEFGPGELLELFELADNHYDMRFEIRACIHHIQHSLNFQLDSVPDDAARRIFDFAFKGHQALGAALSDALQATPFGPEGPGPLDECVSDSDEDEPLSDEETQSDEALQETTTRIRVIPFETTWDKEGSKVSRKDCDCECKGACDVIADPDMPPLEDA